MNLNRRAKLSGAKDLITHALSLHPPLEQKAFSATALTWLWTLIKLAKLTSFYYDVAANVHDD